MKLHTLLISLLCCTAGFSQTISTEAPSVSASAVTVPQGFLQGEFSGGFNINNNGPESVVGSGESPFLLMRYGLTERFELRLQQRMSYNRSGAPKWRYQSLGIGAKYAILPNEGPTNLAVIVNYAPYNGSWRGQQGEALLAFSRTLGDKSTIGANAGFTRLHLSDEFIGPILRTNSVLGSVVYSYQIVDKLTVFGEYYHTYASTDVGDNEVNVSGDANGVDFGLQYLLRDNIQLDWVSGFSLSSKDQFHSIGFNIYFNTNN